MATPFGVASFSRTARSAFNSFRNSSAPQSSRTPRRTRNMFENGSPSMNRRRLAETMIPLHNAAACAKLVTHLSVSSRSCRAFASGSLCSLQGNFYASCQFLPSVRGKFISVMSTRVMSPFLWGISEDRVEDLQPISFPVGSRIKLGDSDLRCLFSIFAL